VYQIRHDGPLALHHFGCPRSDVTRLGKDVLTLLNPAPLEQFHISTIGGHVGSSLSEEFCAAIVSAHGARLRRFSVHRMRMSIASIADVCKRCVHLEQLFVVVEQDALVRILTHVHRISEYLTASSFFLGCSRPRPGPGAEFARGACQPAPGSWLRRRSGDCERTHLVNCQTV